MTLQQLNEKIWDLIAEARAAGLSDDEIEAEIRGILDGLKDN